MEEDSIASVDIVTRSGVELELIARDNFLNVKEVKLKEEEGVLIRSFIFDAKFDPAPNRSIHKDMGEVPQRLEGEFIDEKTHDKIKAGTIN